MSVKETMVSRKMTMSMNDGVSANGNDKTVTRTYNKLNEQATAEEMHATAEALAGLMAQDLAGIYYDDKKLLE